MQGEPSVTQVWQIGHRDQLVIAVKQWQTTAHETGNASLVQQTLQVAPAAAWHRKDLATAPIADLEFPSR